ncbi:hypothetical protein HQ520_11110 [bacterium]|nr:hypothetical protein [bacterium]
MISIFRAGLFGLIGIFIRVLIEARLGARFFTWLGLFLRALRFRLGPDWLLVFRRELSATGLAAPNPPVSHSLGFSNPFADGVG